MRVFMPVLGQDTGGQGFRIKQAFDRLDPSFEVRSMATKKSYIAYPADMVPDLKKMQREYDAADVIHHRNNLSAYRYLDHDQGKPSVVHHQGTAYRTKAHFLDAVCREVGAIQCVSTIDLEIIHGHTWLPAPFDLEWLVEFGAQARASRTEERIVISHAPTNRAIKSTNLVQRVVRRLQDMRYPVKLDLIEGRPWEECLERKARSDIYIDQLILGYGNNAVESWAMGVPVVVGVADPRVSRRMQELIGYLPFWEATEKNLLERLIPLVESADARGEAAARGIGYVRDFHDGRRTVELLREMWTSAPPTGGTKGLVAAEAAALYPQRTGVMITFRIARHPALMVRIGDRKFKFVGGRLRVDEAEAPMIEEFAARRPEYGIVRETPPTEAPVEVETVETTETTETYVATEAEPEAEPEDEPKLSVREMRDKLRELGLSPRGNRAELEERLEEAYQMAEADAE